MTDIAHNTLAFGTDGIRGNAESFPFTNEALIILGLAIAQWAREKYLLSLQPKLLIARDTRISSERIQNYLSRGLVLGGINIVDGGILPTPTLCQLITYEKSYQCGIVISASHNPYKDNGIKIFDSWRCKLTTQDEQSIIHFFEKFKKANKQEKNVTDINHWQDAAIIYNKHIEEQFSEKFLTNFHIVLDLANGATFQIAPMIFASLGAKISILNNNPNGKNINENCGALHPEELSNKVQSLGAHCGFAFDGDGDRIVVVNNKGEIKNGDDILALLLQHPRYKESTAIVGTIISNQGLQQYIEKQGKKFHRTKVGDKYVLTKLEEEGLYLGGEPSGHIILRDYLATGDGIFVALRVLEAIIYNNNWTMETFTKYPQIIINLPINQKKDLTSQPYASVITDHENMLQNGRLIIRYSGTEPLLRIMVEALYYEDAQHIAKSLEKKLSDIFDNNH